MKKVAPMHETVSIRRISWADLYKLRPDLKPDNDNQTKKGKAA